MEHKGWMRLDADFNLLAQLLGNHEVCAWCGRELFEEAISVILSTEGLDSNPNDWGLWKDDKEDLFVYKPRSLKKGNKKRNNNIDKDSPFEKLSELRFT